MNSSKKSFKKDVKKRIALKISRIFRYNRLESVRHRCSKKMSHS